MYYLKYRIVREWNEGTEEHPVLKKEYPAVIRPADDENLEQMMEIARGEAYGEITVEEVPDPVTEPTQLDRVEAQVTYTALMTDTLLDYEEE